MENQARSYLGAATIAFLCWAGCTVGPDYRRPALDTPAEFRGPVAGTNQLPVEVSFGDIAWWGTFNDPQLQSLIREALANSYDIRLAASRVLQAEAIVGITRSQYFPTINAGGDLVTSRASENGAAAFPSGSDPQREYGDVFISMPGYELDLWGRIRRANEAARATLLATEEAQLAVRQTLVSQVATAYLQLLELDLEMEIARRSYASRTNSLALTTSREEGGVAEMQDVYQARILVATADAAISDIQRQMEQKENELSILLGRNPGTIERGSTLTNQTVRAEVPAGIPSSLLERRPDIRAAEQQLIAANANIGEARAAFYPRITLTGFYGHQTAALSDLFTGATRAWQFGPSISVPIFTGGRLRSNLKFTEARFQEFVLNYQQTVQEAFRDVSDGLIAYQRNREFREKQEQRTDAHRSATELANVRYTGGVASYLEVLYNEQELFNAELTLAEARRDELLSVVQLYRALGGGWQQSDPQLSMN
ncbi:MAG TPA: efflux transporter outer membrane subunit [Verrucomicrobiae bacterium]